MANSVGNVTIGVAADFAEFVSGLTQAQAEARKWAREVTASIQEAGNLMKEALSFVGVGFSLEGIKSAADSIGQLASESLHAAERLGNLQQTLGVTAATMQTVQLAATLVGGNIDTATNALTKLDRSAAQASAGNAKLLADFNAIGISSTQLASLLKNPDDLIRVVTEHLAGFADGAGKTAISMALMGRGAGEVVPLVNKLGQEYKQLSEEARNFNGVSDAQLAAMARTQEALNKTGAQIKGLKLQFTAELLPAIDDANKSLSAFLGSPEVKSNVKGFGDAISYVTANFKQLQTDFLTGGFGYALSKVFIEGTQSGKDFSTAIQLGFAKIQEIGAIAWAGIKEAARVAMASMEMWLSNLAGGGALVALTQGNVALSKQLLKVSEDFKASGSAASSSAMDIALATDAYNKQAAAILNGAVPASKTFITFIDGTRDALDRVKKPLAELPEATKTASDKIGKELLAMQDMLDKLAGKVGGPYAKAWEEYNAAITRASEMARQYAKNGGDAAVAQQFLADATALAKTRFTEETDAATALNRVIDDANKKFTEQTRLLTLTSTQRAVEIEYTKLMTEADKALLSVMGPLTEADQKRLDSLKAIAIQTVKTDEAIKNSKAIIADWTNAVSSGFDSVGHSIAGFATGAIKTWKDFGKSLLNDAKQFIAQIIEEFLKLKIFNSILNGMDGGSRATFGGGFGSYLQAGMGLISGGGLSSTGSIPGGGSYSLVNPGGGSGGGNWLSGMSNMSTLGGAYNTVSGLFGGGALAGSGAIPGGGSYSLMDAGGGGGGLSGLSTIGIIGGVIAGIKEFTAAGGGIAGAAGGVAYGVGTYAAGVAVTTALSSGLAAGLASIPVVGWIALAAMAINMISGGKLFGTAGKPIGGSETETIGAGGASLSAHMTFKGQHALFGGSYLKDHNIPIDPATSKAATDFYNALVSGRDAFAKQFNVSMGDIVGGTFVTTFDKKGKETGTTSTVLGQSYAGETQQQFAARLQADNFLAVLDKMGLGASKFVQSLQGNADKLFAAVQDFASVTQNISTNVGNGFKFLGITGDQTIKTVMAFVQGLQAGGETLTQTYARLLAAQQNYDKFVSQFKPATTYVDDFQGSMAKLFDGMLAARKQANDLAIAAGATGAAIGDLTNIQRTYAVQMAQLLIQLQASAQSLAFSLGLSNQGSLQQINDQIAQLTAKGNQAIPAVQGVGNAIQQVSQQAASAVNLLLGTLSPLNDQQKLQVALQGLRAGTATQSEVLTIGRNLYASSQAYNDLFAQVMQSTGGPADGGGRGARIGGTTATGGTVGLSKEDQATLDDLKARKASLDSANSLNQYTTLTRQIAEIASAKGIDAAQVIKDMGINMKDLEKGLGLKSDKQLFDMIAGFQKQVDSAGNNTTSIVNAISMLPQQIANAIAGKPIFTNSVPGPGIRPNTPPDTTPPVGGVTDPGDRPGRGFAPRSMAGNAQPGNDRTITDGDANAIGNAVARSWTAAIAPTMTRSGRMPVYVR